MSEIYCTFGKFLPLQRNAKIEAELGGYDIAKYIPVSSETGSEVSDEEEVSVDTTTDEESVLSTGSQFEDFFHSEGLT